MEPFIELLNEALDINLLVPCTPHPHRRSPLYLRRVHLQLGPARGLDKSEPPEPQ
jgi:hypothetical protein